jgi:hypothetical protein
MSFDLVENVMENAVEKSDTRNLEKYNARSAIFFHRVFHHVFHQVKPHRFSRTVTSGLRGRPGRHPGSRPEEVSWEASAGKDLQTHPAGCPGDV